MFTIYKKFPENVVGNLMGHGVLGRPIGRLPRVTEHLKSCPVFSDEILQTEIRVPFLQSHL